MILGLLFMDPLIRLFGATDSLVGYAREYLSVILLGSVLMTFSMASNSIARAEGNANIAMISMVIGMGMNIVLDPVFIFGFKMGIRGAAIATVISQFLSCVWLIIYFTGGRSSLHIKIKHLIPDFGVLGEIITLGLPAFIRHLGASVLAAVLNNTLRIYGGDMYIATAGVINRLTSFTLMPLFGLAQGFQPIAGFNFGAKKTARVKESLKISIITGTIISVFFFLIMFLFPGFLMRFFTTNEEMITIGRTVLRIVIVAMPLVGLQVLGATYFQAIGKAFPSIILGLSRQVLFLIPLAVLLPLAFGLNGVFYAFPTADILATIVTGLWLIFDVRKLNKELSAGPPIAEVSTR
jgi:putative MATE family efflux protein